MVHIVEKAETVLSGEFKALLSAFPKDTEHIVYNSRFRNSTDSMEELVRASAQTRLISELHKHFPMCMPDLVGKNKQFVENFVATTEAIDLIFP